MRRTKYLGKLQNSLNMSIAELYGLGSIDKGNPNTTYKHMFDNCAGKQILSESKHENVIVIAESNCGLCRKRFYSNEYPERSK